MKKELEITLYEPSTQEALRGTPRAPRFLGFYLQKRVAGMPWNRTGLTLNYMLGDDMMHKLVHLEGAIDLLDELVVTVEPEE